MKGVSSFVLLASTGFPRVTWSFSPFLTVFDSLRVSSKWWTLYKAKIPFSLLLAPPLIIDVLSTNGNLCWICIWAINVCIIKKQLWGFTNFFSIFLTVSAALLIPILECEKHPKWNILCLTTEGFKLHVPYQMFCYYYNAIFLIGIK